MENEILLNTTKPKPEKAARPYAPYWEICRCVKKLFKFGGDDKFSATATVIVTVLGLAIILGVWHYVSAHEIVPPQILPDPLKIVSSLPALVNDYHLFGNIWYTVKLNLMCYIYAILISIPLGFFIGLYPINNVLFGRYINSLRYTPIPCLTGLFIAIFGLTFGMKTAFLTFGLMIYILPTVVNKVNDLQNPNNVKDNVYLQTIQTLGATNWQKFRYVYFPYVTSNIADEIITLTGISYSYVVICEMIYKDGNVSGIGALINTMIRQSYMAEAFALLVIIIAIGCLQDVLFKGLKKLLFPYK